MVASMITTNAEFYEFKSFIEDQNLFRTSSLSKERKSPKLIGYRLIGYTPVYRNKVWLAAFYNVRVLSSVALYDIFIAIYQSNKNPGNMNSS